MLSIMKENVEDLLTTNLWLALPAELVGTLVVTLLGCSSWKSEVNFVYVALTFGLAITVAVWVFHHISGGHVNPAVTIAALFTRRVSIIRGVLYIIAQIVGAIVGAGILYGVSSNDRPYSLGVNKLAFDVSSAQGFGVELIITFVYVLVVFASLDDKRPELKPSAHLTIGLAAVAVHLFAAPYTRVGMNPARSFAPALIMSEWEDHWVFWVGPIAGALLGGLVYDYIFAAGATFAGVKKCLLRIKRPRQVPEPDKAPFEENKIDVIEIEESKVDAEKQPDGAQAEGENGKAELVEFNEENKK